MVLGLLLLYLGRKGVLEALLMIPMGLGMATVNAGVMFFTVYDPASGLSIAADQAAHCPAPPHVAPLAQDTNALINILQINWLQPIYTFMFSNGLIACFVFMGIGTLLDVGFVMARPFQSMIIALFAELGTATGFPLAVAMGLNPGQAASVATIGGRMADGAVHFVDAGKGIVGADHGGGLPVSGTGLRRLSLPDQADDSRKAARAANANGKKPDHHFQRKLVFAVIACVLLSLLFPVASPLLLSLFLGVVIRESDLPNFYECFSNTVLYGSTSSWGCCLACCARQAQS